MRSVRYPAHVDSRPLSVCDLHGRRTPARGVQGLRPALLRPEDGVHRPGPSLLRPHRRVPRLRRRAPHLHRRSQPGIRRRLEDRRRPGRRQRRLIVRRRDRAPHRPGRVGASHTCAVLERWRTAVLGDGIALGYPADRGHRRRRTPLPGRRCSDRRRGQAGGCGRAFTCALYEDGQRPLLGPEQLGQLGYGHTDDLFGQGTRRTFYRTWSSVARSRRSQWAAAMRAHCSNRATFAAGGSNTSVRARYRRSGSRSATTKCQARGARCARREGFLPLATWIPHVRHHRGWIRPLLGNGVGDFSTGPLGQGGSESMGDDETPAQAGNINVGGSVSRRRRWARASTCALLSGGRVRCWGIGGRAKSSLETSAIRRPRTSAMTRRRPASATSISVGRSRRSPCWGCPMRST